MQRVKKLFTRIHLVLWILFGLLVALQVSQDTVSWGRVTLGFLLTCLYVFYGHFFLLTRYAGQSNKGDNLRKLAAIVLTGPVPFLIIHPNGLATWGSFLGYYMMTLSTAVPLFVFLGWLARVTENLVLNTIRKEQLEKQAVEAELYYLKSQINPHFLFNTLNNIHTLVYKQAATAPEAVQRLASLMRYMIYESNATTVPLAKEIDYLQDYMGLQQLRYRNNPVVDLTVVGDTALCHVAPLLFIHLLENAYKHSPARLEPGDIQVKVEVEEDALTFTVQNAIGKRAASALDEPGGIGLPNVQKRLQLIYPGKHSLSIRSTDVQFVVEVKITDIQTHVHATKAQLLHH